MDKTVIYHKQCTSKNVKKVSFLDKKIKIKKDNTRFQLK